jgi:deoxyribodipyrimidine photo-lyase
LAELKKLKMSKAEISVFWFRRDLRLNDNAGLYHALRGNRTVLPLFIFDKNILATLENKKDRRIDFIHQAISHLQEELQRSGSSLYVIYESPEKAFKKLLSEYDLKAVYTNHDYEPYAKERDEGVKKLLEKNNIELHSYKDQVIFEKDEVLKDDGKPYTVFTPYSRKWKSKLNVFFCEAISG